MKLSKTISIAHVHILSISCLCTNLVSSPSKQALNQPSHCTVSCVHVCTQSHSHMLYNSVSHNSMQVLSLPCMHTQLLDLDVTSHTIQVCLRISLPIGIHTHGTLLYRQSGAYNMNIHKCMDIHTYIHSSVRFSRL